MGAVSAHFEPAYDDVESAIALNLALEAIEKIALEFHDPSTAQTRHVNVVALGAPFVEVLFALHVHEIEFID